MEDNGLCAGLALLMCASTVLMHAQPGSSSGTPAQHSTGQGFSLSVSAKATLGLAAVGIGYGLYRWYRRRSNLERTERLHYAVRRGDVATVQALLQAGADVSATDWRGYTPLHRAVKEGQDAVVGVLLAAGATVDDVNNDGWTPLCRAAENGHTTVVKILLGAGADVDAVRGGYTPLHGAAANGHNAVIRALLKAGATVDYDVNMDGQTPLHRAAQYGRGAVVRILLEAGANVDSVDTRRRTPLYSAAGNGHDAVVCVLLEAGAKVDTVCENGQMPLYEAASFGYGTTARLLAACGVTPLTRAACERLVSRTYPGNRQWVWANLTRLQSLTEQASLERKHAIESTLSKIQIDAERLPRDLQRLIISLSEHSDVLALWRKVEVDRLRSVSYMRLPIEALERIVTFDSPQDIGLFRRMLE